MWWFLVFDWYEMEQRTLGDRSACATQLVQFLIHTIMPRFHNGNNHNHKILRISINFNWNACMHIGDATSLSLSRSI